VLPFQLLIAALGGWLQREQADVIAFLREENGILKARVAGQRLRFDDSERRRLVQVGQMWSPHARASRDLGDAGHHPTLASRAGRSEVDLRRRPRPLYSSKIHAATSR
jgi:hypothetical protein